MLQICAILFFLSVFVYEMYSKIYPFYGTLNFEKKNNISYHRNRFELVTKVNMYLKYFCVVINDVFIYMLPYLATYNVAAMIYFNDLLMKFNDLILLFLLPMIRLEKLHSCSIWNGDSLCYRIGWSKLEIKSYY